jgi:hypothetical protein
MFSKPLVKLCVGIAVSMVPGRVASADATTPPETKSETERSRSESLADMLGVDATKLKFFDREGVALTEAEFNARRGENETFAIEKRVEDGQVVEVRISLTGKTREETAPVPLPIEMIGTRLDGPELTALDGTRVDWFRPGAVTVINLWYVLCGSCVHEIPILNRISERFHGRPIRFIAVTFDAPADVRAFTARHPFAFIIGTASHDALNPILQRMGDVYPTQLVLDDDGILRGVFRSVAKEDDLDSAIYECLGRVWVRWAR